MISKDMHRAWEEFVKTGRVGNHQVRQVILDSWKRCRNAGVNPYGGICCKLLESWQLDEVLAQNQELIHVARPFMLRLFKFLRDSEFIVMLTDANGYILETFGNEAIMKTASELNFVVGGCWKEENVGSNSIGIVINTREPIQISGAEHYCVMSQNWTCSAAPIFDDSNNMIGIFNVSGNSSASHSHTLGMVVAAVEAIEHQMRLNKQNRQLSVANQRFTNMFNNISEAVIFVNRIGIVELVNPVAKRMLGDVDGSQLEDLIIGSYNQSKGIRFAFTEFNDVELSFKGRTGSVNCVVSGSIIKDDSGVINGIVMILRHIEKVQTLVKRFSGRHASFHFADILGNSEKLKEAIRLAFLAADKDGTILLQGESGTGKEIFAQSIHNASSRFKGPFVAVNCGAIPRELIASELFGYSEGAFTGAKRSGRLGKFELANGGTLFLDEIGDMPIEQQVTLLRALQERRIVRVGDDKVIPVDVRVICATNKDLLVEIEKNNFRKDLFYRINVINIRIPSLRERLEDIPLLFDYFADQVVTKNSYPSISVDPIIYDYLQRYSWPGNIRELQNIVERIVMMANGGEITVDLLPNEIINSLYDTPLKDGENKRVTVEGVRLKKASEECKQIQTLLIKNEGNVTKVANEMGISRNSLYKKLRKYNIN